MELQFEKRNLSCLEACLRENRSDEETLELRLPEGMPDALRILGAWGQPVLRSKEWHGNRLSAACAMMVWVLYQPEGEEAPRCLEGWIPHSLGWELPTDCPEGTLRLDLLPRFVDARVISARKIMIRSGLSGEAEGWISGEIVLPVPGETPEGLELLKKTYPLQLIREAGEKAFQLSQKLTLPATAPAPDKLVAYTLTPGTPERKLIANKLVFRGSCGLHLVYLTEAGQLQSWDFNLPYSQYAQLEQSWGSCSGGDLKLCATSVEVEQDPEGALEVKCALTAQYIIWEQTLAEVAVDAYAPGRELRLEKETVRVPVILDTVEETVEAERSFSAGMDAPSDVWITPDRPRLKTREGGVLLEVPGQLQLVGYGPEGQLTCGRTRFEGSVLIPGEPECSLSVQLGPAAQPQLLPGAEGMEARIRIPLSVTVMAQLQLQLLKGITAGEQKLLEQEGPSLIIRRVGREGLWELAKDTGSTVAAIQKANGLSGEPGPGQLLLIPLR